MREGFLNDAAASMGRSHPGPAPWIAQQRDIAPREFPIAVMPRAVSSIELGFAVPIAQRAKGFSRPLKSGREAAGNWVHADLSWRREGDGGAQSMRFWRLSRKGGIMAPRSSGEAESDSAKLLTGRSWR